MKKEEEVNWMFRVTPENISKIKKGEVFVFGSNVKGHHLGGAANLAWKEFGAEWGVGKGLSGRSYAIPTLDIQDDKFDKMPVIYIQNIVDKLTSQAKKNKNTIFFVTEIGCGIAGFTVEEIAPLFVEAAKLNNIHLPLRFWKQLIFKKQYKSSKQ